MSATLALPLECNTTLYLSVKLACSAASELLQARATVGSCAADTQRSVGAAAAEDAPLQPTVFSLVLQTVWAALQDYAREQNEAHSLVSRVPPEVLCSIFSYLSLGERISASHVCHSWRNASLAFPANLWSSIPSTSRLNVMGPLLARTAALDIPVDLMGVHLDDYSRAVQISDLLKSHMHHIRTLRISIDDSMLPGGEIAIALETRAPMLEHFFLKNDPDFGLLSFQKAIFCGDAPRLRQIELGPYATSWLSYFVRFRSITFISLVHVSTQPSNAVWFALPKFTNLQSLELATLGGSPGRGRIRLPFTLNRLRIRVVDAEELSPFDVVRVGTIASVRIAPIEGTLPATGVEQFLPRDLCTTTAIFSASSFCFRLRQAALDRVFLEVNTEALFSVPLWELTFGSVMSLTLYMSKDSGTLLELHLPPCSNVEHLVLAYASWPTDYPTNELTLIWMTFPRLRTLSLGASSENLPAMSSDALTSIIPRLRYTAPKLEVLRLRGIVLRPSSAALYTVADAVLLEEGYYTVPDLWEDN
ncbi:hypothetical protein EXIGLDRAFT_832126 [Exidia glandulosa HHB12029]|uniref:F-box domain-containing protein n=1 Tax=Exidia glandulosa HHB12029 TaxID=1314781 RepID=A0A165M005_EXIGL|nr:hypothetical protein EXIGLDRAFT_832126 [Exidia glandulosa HHB12029]